MLPMLQTLAWVLLPLMAGFILLIKSPPLLKMVDHSLNALIYIILFIMGISLSEIPNLAAELSNVLLKTIIFIITILGMNLIGFLLLDRLISLNIRSRESGEHSLLSLFFSSAKLFLSIILGIIMGWLMGDLHIPSMTGQIALTILLFLIGIQLRSNGISLKSVLLNRVGIILSLVAIVTALIGGALASLFIAEIDLTTGLAISSGFGWYSLSFIVISDAYGPLIGSIALLNDLFREFFAFAMIPILMRRYPLSAVGVGGATSLDFTLPLIQKTGGIHIVPIAISFGFILNILTPILLVLFAHW